MKEFNPLERKSGLQKILRKQLGAIVLSGATLLDPGEHERTAETLNIATAASAPSAEQKKLTREQEESNVLNKISLSDLTETIFDNNPEFFKAITKKGDFTDEERKKRTQQLENGATVFRDVGLLFYKVRRGDTLSGIRTSLSRVPEFSYLRSQPDKIESFNIPALELVKDMWIPIPLENKDRYLTDEQFTRYAARSISELRSHDRYGKFVGEILKEVSVKELLATLVAIAKQEAGGQPIGRYELHRWEPRYNVFSFSLFHVLMDGPGLEARRNLNKSEGQLYHPQNASDLVIAYMKEKGADADDFFPLDKHATNFARFYNGKGWKKINPKYVRNILSFYSDAKEMIEALLAEDIPSSPKSATPPPKIIPPVPPQAEARPEQPQRVPQLKRPERVPVLQWEKISRSNLTIAIQNAHYRYVKSHRNETLLKTKQELYGISKEVSKYLVRKYRTSVYYPNEEVAMGKDKFGIFVKFKSNRPGSRTEEFIRP